MQSPVVTLNSIRAAATRIAGSVHRSPCAHSFKLSQLCGFEVYCKLDHTQATGSFKERGACNKLMQLPPATRERGVVAASAGNHALALARHCQRLGIPVTVVMPRWAPLVKVSNCRALGANVILEGERLADALVVARQMSAEDGRPFITGFDDPDIIAGAGTAGLEILEDVPDLDAVIVPAGGGGLIAGVGVAVKALRPAARVIGVEPRSAASLARSLEAGRPVRVETEPTLADGLAVPEVGGVCLDVARDVVDRVVLVDEAQIGTALLRLIELENIVVEGSAASSLAAGLILRDELRGRKVVLCITGGNIDLTMVSRIIERGLAHDGRLCRAIVYTSDRPGSLAKLLAVVAEAGASIKEVGHDRSFGPADVARVAISLVMETRDAAHIAAARAALETARYDFRLA